MCCTYPPLSLLSQSRVRVCVLTLLSRSTCGDRGHESNITAYEASATDAVSNCDTGVLGASQKQVRHSVVFVLSFLLIVSAVSRVNLLLLSFCHFSFGAGKRIINCFLCLALWTPVNAVVTIPVSASCPATADRSEDLAAVCSL